MGSCHALPKIRITIRAIRIDTPRIAAFHAATPHLPKAPEQERDEQERERIGHG